MSLVYLLTVAALDENGDPATLRFANGDYHADGENWPPRLIKPVLFAERARIPWLRPNNTSKGDVELDNSDGRLDYLVDYAMDGRSLTVQTWDGSSLTTVVKGTVSRVEVTRTTIRLILRDRTAVYALPHPQDTYAGDGTDLEGSSDIAGRPKPKVFGSVSNAAPVLVDFGLQIYQVSSLSDCNITAARDRGVSLTDEGAYASQADLLDVSLTPSSGAYKTYQGFIRLGDTAELLTVDAEQSDNSAESVIDAIVTEAGGTLSATSTYTEPYIHDTGDIYEHDTGDEYSNTINATHPDVGIYLDQQRSTQSMLDALATSIGGYWLVNDSGHVEYDTLRFKTSSATIPVHRILEIERKSGGSGENGLPIKKVTVQADRVWTVQNDLAAGASNSQRWQTEYREFIAEDAATENRHLLAEEKTVQTVLRTEAQTLSNRLIDLLSPRRDSTNLTTRLNKYPSIEVGQTITVEHPRFGYSSGREFVVLGRTPDAETGEIIFDLWG